MDFGKVGKEVKSVEPQIDFKSWEVGHSKVGVGGNSCVLDVSFLDSKRHPGSNSSGLLHISLEWEEGKPGNPLGWGAGALRTSSFFHRPLQQRENGDLLNW